MSDSSENTRRERELVLAPNEYAYILDTTKGHISCYVGPNKTSLAQTDQPVVFDTASKRFAPTEMRRAVCLFATAPANWYVSLKNPAKDGLHPTGGTSHSSPDLMVGQKINIAGPISFPLWPGQMARVIRGHRLKSNQYVVIQIYSAEQAQTHTDAVFGTTQEAERDLVAGKKYIIRGTDVSFYMPPDGVEVLPDDKGRYVRNAVTLKRLEYCTLDRENGESLYVRGEAVVFPEPDQNFRLHKGSPKHCAIELDEITGLHIKVIAPYTDADGIERTEGEELFVTGKNRIYFPREEHVIVRYAAREIHRAVAIPAGEARYVLDRLTGEVRLVDGPRMFLPDPRSEVIVRRVLTTRESAAFYPGNSEAAAINEALREGTSPQAGNTAHSGAQTMETGSASGRDTVQRPDAFEGPRTITLDTKYEGAVTIDVWPDFAVQRVSPTGQRAVVVGPARFHMDYGETLETLRLSTGTPKSDEKLLETVYLRAKSNKITHQIEVTTRDQVDVRIGLVMRGAFVGSPERWFAVGNYVKLVCDHITSRLKAQLRGTSIADLQTGSADIIRDCILGEKAEAGARDGLLLDDAGFHVHEIELFEVEVFDREVASLFSRAQRNSVEGALMVLQKERELKDTSRILELEHTLAELNSQAKLQALERRMQESTEEAKRQREHQAQEKSLKEDSYNNQLELAVLDAQLVERQLATRRAEHEAAIDTERARQHLTIERLEAEVRTTSERAAAFSPHLVQAIERLGDETLLCSLAENFGELAAVEGRGLVATARKFLDFVPATFMPTLKPTEIGEAVAPRPAEDETRNAGVGPAQPSS